MTTTRRELLGAGASAALGLLPWGNTAPVLAQASPGRETAGAQTWEDGDLAHVLPTSKLRILGIEGSLSAPLRSADDRHLAMACSLLKVRDFGRILGRGPWLSAI